MAITRNVIYLTLILLISFYGMLNFKKSNIIFRLLTCFLIYTFISEMLAQFASHILGSSALIHEIYLLVHIFFFSCIYYFLLPVNKWKTTVFIGAVSFSLLLSLYYNFQDKIILPAYGIMLEGVLLVAISIAYLFNLIKNPVERKIVSLGEFWFNSNVIFYHSGTFLLWATFDFLFFHKLRFSAFPIILWVFNLIYYGFFGVALVVHIRNYNNEVSANEGS